MINATTLVATGVALLDTVSPDWYLEINVEELDIATSDYCILGQLFGGDYERGVEQLFLLDPDFQASLYGFCYYYRYMGLWERDEEVSSSALTDEWVRVITERKKEGAK